MQNCALLQNNSANSEKVEFRKRLGFVRVVSAFISFKLTFNILPTYMNIGKFILLMECIKTTEFKPPSCRYVAKHVYETIKFNFNSVLV